MDIKFRTFGHFHISFGDDEIESFSMRKTKMWSALKYLVSYRGVFVTAEKLIDILWPEEETEDPLQALRDIIYRLRKALDSLGGKRKYIVYANGCYKWNNELDYELDAEVFEKTLDEAKNNAAESIKRIDLYKKAVGLYIGEYLGDSSDEIWVNNFTNRYRRMYLQAVNELADIYEKHNETDEILSLLAKARTAEPYEETLYLREIKTLVKIGDYAHAKRQCKIIERLLQVEFGVKPSAAITALEIEINNALTNRQADLTEIIKNFDEDDTQKGIVFCSPETFRYLYSYDKRSSDRIPFPVYVGMLTLSECGGNASDDNIKNAMGNLRKVLLNNLRQGDVVSQYSSNQFILMVTSYEGSGSQAALNRMIRIFDHETGHGKFKVDAQIAPIGHGNHIEKD